MIMQSLSYLITIFVSSQSGNIVPSEIWFLTLVLPIHIFTLVHPISCFVRDKFLRKRIKIFTKAKAVCSVSPTVPTNNHNHDGPLYQNTIGPILVQPAPTVAASNNNHHGPSHQGNLGPMVAQPSTSKVTVRPKHVNHHVTPESSQRIVDSAWKTFEKLPPIKVKNSGVISIAMTEINTQRPMRRLPPIE